MKNRIILMLIIVISLFSFVDRVNAEDKKVTFACDYSFNGIKFRVKVNNLDSKYIKSEQEINKANGNSFSMTFMYVDSTGNYVPFTGNTKKYAGYTKEMGSLGIFNDIDQGVALNKKTFIKNATASNKSVSCPSLYYFKDVFNNYKVVPVSSSSSYDDTGIVTNFTPVNLEAQACYTSATDATPIKCDEIDTGELYSENQIECVYSTNETLGVKNEFALIYDRDTNTVKFDGRGLNFAWSSQIDSSSKIVNSDELLSKFKKSDGQKLTCPNNIQCNCTVASGCYFYSSEKKANAKCGVLKSSDGTSVDDSEYHSGDVPDIDFSNEPMTCEELLGPNLTKIVYLFFTVLRVGGAIIALVKATMLLMPAVVAKDAEALKKAGKSCVNLAIALVVIGLLPTLANVIGKIVEFDVTCLI